MNNKYLKYDIVYSSCFLQTLYEQIKYTVNKEDIYASLAQPIGFGLDIDVLSRNWWLGSYSEINYFNPFFEFNIEGGWYYKEKSISLDLIEKYKGHILIIPEFFELKHSPHYQRHPKDIHVMGIQYYDSMNKEVGIFDRYLNLNFNNNPNFTLKIENLYKATKNGYKYFIWSNRKEFNFKKSINKLLCESYNNYFNINETYNPHLNSLVGLKALDGYKSALKMIPINEYNDQRTKYLIFTQLPYNIKQLIIPNKMKFIKLMTSSNNDVDVSELILRIQDTIILWENLYLKLKNIDISITELLARLDILIEKEYLVGAELKKIKECMI